jgi:FkbM family methyltransferase
MLKRIYDYIERKFLIGKIRFQPFFESMHRISLRGMNYGQNTDSESNGEFWVMKYVQAHLIDKDITESILFDVGANKGQYSTLLLSIFKEGNIFCFEPSPFAFNVLNKYFQEKGSVKCFQLGFGSSKNQLDLYYTVEGSTMASFSPFQINSDSKKIEVPVTTIDLFCEEHSIDRIDFLKLDIEGFEIFALRGACRMIKEKKINFIQFEFGQNNIVNGVYLKHFFDLLPHYRINRILKNGLRPLDTYDKHIEIVLTTNYLAELK